MTNSRLVLLLILVVAACATAGIEPVPGVASVPDLTGTSWRLLEFQSSSDRIGTIRPEAGKVYTMELRADGAVAMRLDCNRASGTWSVNPSGDGGSGSFTLGPLAVTRALCPQPSMDERIARDAEYVRSFVLRGGRLYLALMADGGIYVWEPAG